MGGRSGTARRGAVTRGRLGRASAAAVAASLLGSALLGACSTTAPPAPTVTSADDTPTRAAPSDTSTSGGTGCIPTNRSTGPVTSQVVVVTTSATTAPSGSDLAVKTEIVVLSDGPRVIARPQWSALEVLAPGKVVARTVGTTGPDVPTPVTRGTTLPAQTVPTHIALTGCDGQPLPAGAYRLRALVGYGSDALNDVQGGASGAFVMASEPVNLTVT
jgi:hypothetical protein